ncbi:N-formylglutamate amidohydrolase [Formicincola oecophyllae]|uniref:N-formylglutamate amidohydrolase n=1 Tax=Formicincola oecophyllae TaxID=2558361 RepID=A0A4Y6U6F0_9PROT|nr:N-formylglutamate amidohydrolase [Formicincola oecophyllae]QDH12923.1 N-formylglutamate amidohydrolase [Formicincola oecophyllae]
MTQAVTSPLATPTPQQGHQPLLTERDPTPFTHWPETRPTDIVLVCDHGGRAIPEKLGTMGLSEQDRGRHIAWDIGIAAVARRLQGRLGCALLLQNYSRLVVDCNRAPHHATLMAPVSDHTAVPANQALSSAQRQARLDAIYHPYHEAIAHCLEGRARQGRPTLFVSLHSFTPEMDGFKRPWHLGLLHHHDPQSAQTMAALLAGKQAMDGAPLVVGSNQPYALSPESEFTTIHHAAQRQLPALEIELRQDLLAGQAGQAFWADMLAEALPRFLAERALDQGACSEHPTPNATHHEP